MVFQKEMMAVKLFLAQFHPFKRMKLSRGFTLIEVLIALVVLAVGLLGLAGLQVMSLKNNQSTYVRGQANLIAMDVIDRVRVNPLAKNLYLTTVVAVSNNSSDTQCNQCKGTDNSCTPPQLVIQDLCDWQEQLSKLSTEATGAITNINGIYSIAIRWDENRDGAVNNLDAIITINFLI